MEWEIWACPVRDSVCVSVLFNVKIVYPDRLLREATLDFLITGTTHEKGFEGG